ncbi:ABC transporter ATP-binding protein [Pelagibacterium montanilacus]|uniref:ABC transporter ATP-binding protein n=1 Tax=Pelagibacterium montanilacus TaxID=2185280 RepID=UPI000F8EE389|nr:sn-glycerol-3-phosphate ABC transporter ATP-binding protein UgpC [Pelagibacterium montanilacus]
MAPVTLTQISKSFGAVETVHPLDLEVKDHEFLVLVGPSGCGKSTILRMIAGLETVSGGEVRIGDRVVNTLSPGARDVAMVFQNYALYPHMNVARNIAFGLRRRGMTRAQVDEAVLEAARLLEIEPLLGRRPSALSGGQRQRVAMGRAIVRKPKVFLFDEPLSNLDAKLRAQMRVEIKKLHQKVPTTTVYVTHDQVEAMTMADRLVVMNNGRIEQVGRPMDVYAHPRTRFVAEFIGSPAMNFWDGRLEAGSKGLVFVAHSGLRLSVPASRQVAYRPHLGRPMTLGLRPEAISVAPDHTDARDTEMVTIKLVEPLGVETLAFFDVGGVESCARLDPAHTPRAGDSARLTFDTAMMHLIAPDTGEVVTCEGRATGGASAPRTHEHVSHQRETTP